VLYRVQRASTCQIHGCAAHRKISKNSKLNKTDTWLQLDTKASRNRNSAGHLGVPFLKKTDTQPIINRKNKKIGALSGFIFRTKKKSLS
jgi:hypothetical protein